MTMSLKVSGAFVEVRPHLRVAGVWKPVQDAWVKVGGVWKKFYTALTLTASPTSVSGTRDGPGEVITDYTTISVTGGSGTYTYAWSAPFADTIDGDTTATARFRRVVEVVPQTVSGTATVTVTDTVNGVVETLAVPIHFSTTP